MRLAINRYSAMVFGWIPDVSEIPARRLILIGVAVSAALHLLAFLLLVLFSGIFSKPDVEAVVPVEQKRVPPPEEPRPEPEVLPLAPTPQRHFLDTTGLETSKVAPAKPDFESSENGIAASEQPGKGDIPLPNQEGRDLPFAAFKSQRALFGAESKPFPADPSTTSLSPPAPDVPPPSAAQDVAVKPPAPAPQPEKTEKEHPPATPQPFKAFDQRKDDDILITFRKRATPPPLAQVEHSEPKPLPTPVPIATPAPTPIPTPPPVAAVTPKPVQEQAMLVTPKPVQERTMPATPALRAQPPAQTSRQLEQVQTHMEGNISNRGRRAANTVATPFGKYEKQVHDAIASRWQYYVKDHADVIALGSAEVVFIVDSSGRVKGVHLESNTSNQSFADVCERAIREAELPEPPPDVIGMMRDGRLEFPMKFTLYPFQ